MNLEDISHLVHAKEKPIVCVQGLGFVGSATAIAIANSLDINSESHFNVIGVDLPNEQGVKKVESINQGILYFNVKDDKLKEKLKEANDRRNLFATTDSKAYSTASIIVITLPLDLVYNEGIPDVDYTDLVRGIYTISAHMKPDAQIIVSTTVPTGTCEKIIIPEIKKNLKKRGHIDDKFMFSYSYERVTPGTHYYDSIVNSCRVYAGINELSANACESFLKKVINTELFPLFRLESIEAAETAKLLENSYRAVNIAFIEEWRIFSEFVNIDLFKIIEAIQMRETHSNMRWPGFGVGGYCLTKDPLFAQISCNKHFQSDEINFPFSVKAVEVNNEVPLLVFRKLKTILGGAVEKKNILLCGISYRSGIGDTRNSPSYIFYVNAKDSGADVICHDPFLSYWPELGVRVYRTLPDINEIDVIVFGVQHDEYKKINFNKWLGKKQLIIFDANNVLTKKQVDSLRNLNIMLHCWGRGDIFDV